MASTSDMRERFPDAFGDPIAVPDPLLQRVLDEAARCISIDCFTGADYDDAQIYLAAHFLASTNAARGQGVQSVTAGMASVSYEAAMGQSALETTAYGRHLQVPREGVRREGIHGDLLMVRPRVIVREARNFGALLGKLRKMKRSFVTFLGDRFLAFPSKLLISFVFFWT